MRCEHAAFFYTQITEQTGWGRGERRGVPSLWLAVLVDGHLVRSPNWFRGGGPQGKHLYLYLLMSVSTLEYFWLCYYLPWLFCVQFFLSSVSLLISKVSFPAQTCRAEKYIHKPTKNSNYYETNPAFLKLFAWQQWFLEYFCNLLNCEAHLWCKFYKQ
jgi:hypothetical protein